MDEELERQLVDEYPELYEWYDKDPDATDGPVPPLTAYGFSVGDGWYELLESLSEVLTRREVDVEVHQVKEKFGGLRFYHGGVESDEERDAYMAMGAIRHAEEMSFHVCEDCGAAAELRQQGWFRTLCDECWTEEKARRRERSPRDLTPPDNE